MVGYASLTHPTKPSLYSVSCLWPHCLQANLTRVAPFSACRRFGAPHLPQVVSIRVLPCLMVRAFLAMVSRIRRSASSRIACLSIRRTCHEERPLRSVFSFGHDLRANVPRLSRENRYPLFRIMLYQAPNTF